MGQTYVYNLGSFNDAKSKEISLEVGLFFDGTGNNHTNTEIRKKIKKVDEYADQSKPENRATLREKAIYYSTLLDDSYKNDFSNVARLWRGCKKDYKIYIEGIGTNDKRWDNLYPGMALGEGITGIRGKVRQGCKKLADKIQKKIESNDIEKIKNIYVTIDVFGFSRGAAAARNFLYEIGNNKKDKDRKVTSENEFVKVPIGGAVPSIIYTEIHRDKDGFQVNPAYLDNGKMPQMGYLGYYLLQHKLTHAELKKITLTIRFVGLYDTVASYGKEHENDVGELQLNNLGKPKKVVHFTAMDEHREKFALSKIQHDGVRFIEKEFPGVHSDIGGGYNDNSKDEDKPEKITEIAYVSYETAQKEMDKLLLEYWYSSEQIKIHPHLQVSSPNVYPKPQEIYYYLEGKRKIKKEYSYIPLHFMEILFRNVLSDRQTKVFQPSIKIINEYSIAKDSILVKAKNHLISYILGNDEKKWEFIPDEAKEMKKPDSRNRKIFMYYPPKEENQLIIRELRLKYLHRSAKAVSIAHSPAQNRERPKFPKK